MNETQAIEILSLQNELNINTVGKDWKSGKADNGRKVDYPLCVGMEASELLDSFNWKHWKDINAPHNLVNAKIEVVDIMHFLASWALQDSKENLFINMMTKSVDGCDDMIKTIKSIIVTSMDESPKLYETLSSLKSLMTRLEINDEVYDLYIGKNVLNKFRQDSGYADGSYVKIWHGREDNEAMIRTIHEIRKNGEEVTFDSLYSRLRYAYRKVLEEAGA